MRTKRTDDADLSKIKDLVHQLEVSMREPRSQEQQKTDFSDQITGLHRLISRYEGHLGSRNLQVLKEAASTLETAGSTDASPVKIPTYAKLNKLVQLIDAYVKKSIAYGHMEHTLKMAERIFYKVKEKTEDDSLKYQCEQWENHVNILHRMPEGRVIPDRLKPPKKESSQTSPLPPSVINNLTEITDPVLPSCYAGTYVGEVEEFPFAPIDDSFKGPEGFMCFGNDDNGSNQSYDDLMSGELVGDDAFDDIDFESQVADAEELANSEKASSSTLTEEFPKSTPLKPRLPFAPSKDGKVVYAASGKPRYAPDKRIIGWSSQGGAITVPKRSAFKLRKPNPFS